MALMVAFACGGSSGGGGGSKGTIKIGSDLPVCTSGGQTTANGVKFAVDQKNAAGGVNGYTIAYQSFDDCVQGAYSADAGVQNVQTMLGDSKFLGMIGPFNSAVAKAEIPLAAAQHFTMISPSNTSPCLTKLAPTVCNYDPATLRNGNPNNYWRVVTTDDYQGPAQADYFYKTLNIHNVGILDDSTVFGVGIAAAFEAEFKTLGGTTKHSEYQKATTTDFKTILLNFKNAGAQGVYAGGTSDQNLCVPRKQMKDLGWDVPFGGGDGIEESLCIDEAAGNEAGIYATSAGADATKVPGATASIAAFRKAFPGANDFGGYTMQGYDATNALMAAIGRAINDANGSTPTRDQVRVEMSKTKGFVGVIGTYDFDQNGDTSLKIVSIYEVQQVSDPSQSSGVCGSKAANLCFIWKDQVNYATK
ncbi:MAG TPA: branched-chain amino acid ABC transporter substrate-binding protein [Candidatus Dormibacteraeota bacterium]|jgi:branched-chain amino acid transport system substrate-binding protein|nr:branched-chain amino acid ABC transporter substrate-binding protein [Candidatus Dormibacteraeota bacterium]